MRARLAALAGTVAVAGCEGAQSAFDPAGLEAERVLLLFWIMLGGGVAIWIAVIAVSVYAAQAKTKVYSDRTGVLVIIWCGCVFPTVVLAALLWWGLAMMPDLRRPADGPTIAVSGERFWWRVAYAVEGGPGVIRNLPRGGVPSSNEIWIPLGKRTEILLSSPDVIHSFWVPPLAGKMDAVPGRVNRLVLEPTETGVYHGACAEYCGTAHAYMGLRVFVVPEDEFEAYVAAQARPAAVDDGRGAQSFLENGCAACHTVRGTPADGDVGPDLTHVASRSTIGAGLLPTTIENFAEFIRSTDHVKPGVEMPSFGMLPEEEIVAIAEWLETLE
ncbi:cytochrome c oxidase subunit II [Citreimonas salinaria]|uniref:Cytochrome aa3 subunit 2 n=1 Tax=Citreimonas salinaria TaxID=321339 RepID=A0A1H3NDB7_9RHOB|nr:cytochrome c oxidase subunit II [Citreimonas salinaria]SDY86754.1 cytochrome c oxidase subunit 2 [Citreimonas salinaria]